MSRIDKSVPLHELRKIGARKSKPSAASTSTVAITSAALTSRFGNGRVHASPSAQTAFKSWNTSQ